MVYEASKIVPAALNATQYKKLLTEIFASVCSTFSFSSGLLKYKTEAAMINNTNNIKPFLQSPITEEVGIIGSYIKGYKNRAKNEPIFEIEYKI